MTWTRLDDDFHSNPKVMQVGLEGAGLYARALSYCGHYLTDGFVPSEWAKMVSGKSKDLPQKLVRVGLWEQVEEGYVIPGYLDLNPSRMEVQKRRVERAE